MVYFVLTPLHGEGYSTVPSIVLTSKHRCLSFPMRTTRLHAICFLPRLYDKMRVIMKLALLHVKSVNCANNLSKIFSLLLNMNQSIRGKRHLSISVRCQSIPLPDRCPLIPVPAGYGDWPFVTSVKILRS